MPRPSHRFVVAGVAVVATLATWSVRVQADAYTDIQAQIDRGQLREAAEAASKLTGTNASDCQAWKLLGDARRRLARVDEAAGAYNEGLKACPDDKGILRVLGMLYDETEQYEQAVRVLDHLWSIDQTDPAVASRLGAAAYRAGRCAEGKRAFDVLLKAHPDRILDRMMYAQLLGRSCRDYAAAEAEYNTIIAQRPNDPEIHCALSYLLSSAGRTDDAVKAAQKGISMVHNGAACLYAAWGRALEVGADSLMAKGEVEQARSLYRQAVEPLSKGTDDPVFGEYCKAIMAEVRYKEAPMEELVTR